MMRFLLTKCHLWNNSFLFKNIPSIVFLFKKSLLLIVPAFLLFLFSCKEPNTIGLEIQPPNDKPNVAICDTSKVDVYIVKEDSLRTDHLSSNLLGSYNDQIFGITTAGFYSQFRLPTTGISFGNFPTIDSVVLAFKYSGFYGDTITPLTFHAYELTESMNHDSTYFSNKTLANDGNDLVNITMVPKIIDSVNVGGIKTSPHLRLKLNNTLGQKILNATADQLSDNTKFLEFFKGLYISTDQITGNNTGTILYLSQVSSSFLSGITLYYRNITDTLKHNYTIAVDYDCINYNYFNHNYTNATDTLKSMQTSHTPKYVGNLAYIQAMAGIKTKIIFPNIMEWAKIKNIAINQAELLISVEGNNTFIDKYAPSSQLALVGIDSTGKTYFLKDQTGSDNFFGGTYDATAKQYKFNISRHVQYLIQNKIKQFGMYMLTYGAGVTANRTVFKAGQNPAGKIKLSIIYTKL
ncbi:MAG: DUF4270 domain-containing protein [Bacteroidales bacterium]|nr:DUF4270 domain-containing protein [Bacteroidales bacterium]